MRLLKRKPNIKRLSKKGDEASITSLVNAALSHRDDAVRENASDALQTIPCKYTIVSCLMKRVIQWENPSGEDYAEEEEDEDWMYKDFKSDVTRILRKVGSKPEVVRWIFEWVRTKGVMFVSEEERIADIATAIIVGGLCANVPALSEVSKAIKDDNLTLRQFATITLAKIADKSTVPKLVEALDDGTLGTYVHLHVIKTLRRIRDKSAVPSLIKALNRYGSLAKGLFSREENPYDFMWSETEIVATLCSVLAEIGDKSVVLPLLLENLKKDNPILVAHSAFHLGTVGDRSAVPALIRLLNNEVYPEISTCAIQALGSLGDKRAVPVLIKQLQKEDFPPDDFDEMVVMNLEKITGRVLVYERKYERKEWHKWWRENKDKL